MFFLSIEGVAKARQARETKILALNTFLGTPFNPENPEHRKALHEQVVRFEWHYHLMRVAQGGILLNAVLPASLIMPFFSLVPEFMLSYATILGLSSLAYQYLNQENFLEEVTTAQRFYTWVMNGGDTTSRLEIPEIFKLTELLASLCPKAFMVKWPSVVTRGTNAYPWYHPKAYLPASFNGSKDERIDNLKQRIQSETTYVNPVEGLNQALRYFSQLLKEGWVNFKNNPLSPLKTGFILIKDQLPSLPPLPMSR